jgi:hypothetical protein
MSGDVDPTGLWLPTNFAGAYNEKFTRQCDALCARLLAARKRREAANIAAGLPASHRPWSARPDRWNWNDYDDNGEMYGS